MNEDRIKRWLPFVVFLFFVGGVIASADRGRLNSVLGWINGYPLFDKAGHVALIGTLAFLLNRAFGGRKIGRLQLGGLIIAAVMTLEEFSQAWMPTRTFDYGDLAANYLGVTLAEIGWRTWHRSPDRTVGNN